MNRMTTVAAIAALALLTSLTPIAAQDAVEELAMRPTVDDPMMADVLANMDEASEKILALAEATPAEWFGWRPNDTVRTVSEVYIHVVAANLLLPPALGAEPPPGIDMSGDFNAFALMAEWEKTITEKDAVIAKLRQSFEYAADAMAGLDEMDAEVEIFGPARSKRSWVFMIMSHAHEHLGQSIAYARAMGITPPWSAGEGEG